MNLKLFNEIDLNKINNGTLINLTSRDKSKCINMINKVPVFLQTHANDEGLRRCLSTGLSVKYKNLIMDSTVNNYQDHILEIFMKVFKKYQLYYNDSVSLENRLIENFFQIYQDIPSINDWDDNVNDVPHKICLYRRFKYMSKYYVLEAALPLTVSLLSYKFKPLFQLQNSLMYNEILNNTKIMSMIDILHTNLNNPVINITGYTTWFRYVTDINKMDYIPLPLKAPTPRISTRS